MARAGRNNHLNGMSGKHWGIPFISGGNLRKAGVLTAVSAGFRRIGKK